MKLATLRPQHLWLLFLFPWVKDAPQHPGVSGRSLTYTGAIYGQLTPVLSGLETSPITQP